MLGRQGAWPAKLMPTDSRLRRARIQNPLTFPVSRVKNQPMLEKSAIFTQNSAVMRPRFVSNQNGKHCSDGDDIVKSVFLHTNFVWDPIRIVPVNMAASLNFSHMEWKGAISCRLHMNYSLDSVLLNGKRIDTLIDNSNPKSRFVVIKGVSALRLAMQLQGLWMRSIALLRIHQAYNTSERQSYHSRQRWTNHAHTFAAIQHDYWSLAPPTTLGWVRQ